MTATDKRLIPAPDYIQIESGSGQPLPAALRTRMESSFGVDFSTVRIHENTSPKRIGAKAFVIGHNITFAPGTYRPETAAGLLLLAHELAHVVQQADGRTPLPPRPGLSVLLDDQLEAEADAMAMAAVTGVPARYALRPLPEPNRPVLQAFWVRQDNGTTVWRPANQWNAALYDYLTWTWPCCGWPRGVYQYTCLPKNHDIDEIYPDYRDNLNAKIGGGLQLDTPGVWNKARPMDCIQQLVHRFNLPGWFLYTMRLQTFLDANGDDQFCRGDCLSLCVAFVYIAKHEFGVNVQVRCQPTPYLTNGGATIDQLALGNCNNGNHWFFQNHYWISVQGKTGAATAYDLLMGAQGTPVINPNWVQTAEAHDVATLVNGTQVQHGPQYNDDVPVPGQRTQVYVTVPPNPIP